ncbi:MAG: hypothetical protein Q4Q20_02785 [Methanocorpusculum sp.]|nr:hypothetical protein [Methanocorpusculum sp.]
MKKSFIVLLAAAVLLSAVICTAGCVAPEPADKITGVWVTENDDIVTFVTFYTKGSGAIFYTADKGCTQIDVTPKTWTADGNDTYTVISADGTAEQFILDVEGDILSAGDVTFVRVDEARTGEYLTLLVYSYDEE